MKTKKVLNCMGKYILCILCIFFSPIVDVKIFDINLGADRVQYLLQLVSESQ